MRKLLGIRIRPPGRRAVLAAAVTATAAVTIAAGGLPWQDADQPAPRERGALAGLTPDPEAAEASPEPASSDPHRLATAPQIAAEEADLPAEPKQPDISEGAPSDAEVQRDLRQLERRVGTVRLHSGGARNDARLASDGTVNTPSGAPAVVAELIAGGNSIARFPYRFGGGHGSFVDNAYDCSGSVSYALAAAGLLDEPIDSGRLMRWGEPGRGGWLTVYANRGHVYMEVAGVRFDTSGRDGRRGSRWQEQLRSSDGFTARHWPGL